MQIEHANLNRLTDLPPADAVVVIDVLRSFTTAACAFAGGVRRIWPVENASAGFLLARQLPTALLAGAHPGGKPIEAFDLPNSPAALRQRMLDTPAHLTGRELILSTAAGVRGLLRFGHAPLLLGAALVNARATAIWLRQQQPGRVVLLATGEWLDRDGDEDRACADYLEALLTDGDAAAAPFERRVRLSDFGRRFDGSQDDLPPADLDIAAVADCYSFAIVARREAVHDDDRLCLHAEHV